jgi:predicted ATPase
LIPGQPPEYPAAVLDSIRLQNFKTHRDTEIKLGRLTVLVGPNGSGKSSVLQAIELLRNPSARSAFKSIPRPGEVIGECEIEIAGHYTDGKAWLRSARDTTRRATHDGVVESWPDDPAGPNAMQSDSIEIEASVQAVMLNPDPKKMAAPVRIKDVSPKLDGDGSGLAEVVAIMRDSDDDSFQALQAALSAVVPQIERIRVQRQILSEKTYKSVAYGLLFDVAGRKNIPASMMSGGTLLALAILALLHSRSARASSCSTISITACTHAQWDLLKQLRKLLDQFPDLQIVATSHSPDLVDELDPSEVIVLALREDGTSAARPLTECPREDMLGVLKAGQLWSAIGEDWVKAADPVEPAP